MTLPLRVRAAVSPPGPGGRGGRDDLVEFYETEEFLLETVNDFVGEALRAGDAAILIASRAHLRWIDAALRAGGIDLAAAVGADRYLALDASPFLDAFMVGTGPAAGRFQDAVGRPIRRATCDGRRVRIYTELVAILWEAGDRASAIVLGDLWNDLAALEPFAVLCAFPMSAFDDEASAGDFKRICAQHATVLPSEAYPVLASADEQRRAVAQLQQEAVWLRAELARSRAEAEASPPVDARGYAEPENAHTRADQRTSSRDRAAADRDRAAADRDNTASDRDRSQAAADRRTSTRDVAAADREQAAARRDDTASDREHAAGPPDDGTFIRDQAAADRAQTAADRDQSQAASDERTSNRDRAAADRAQAAVDRQDAAVDRAAATHDRLEARAELRRAQLDPLTGAFGRELGLLALEGEINRARRGDGRLVLAYVDVDGLKQVNDRQGHAAGDALLRDVVDAIHGHLRSYDPVVRVGGDEFVCALAGSTADEARSRFAKMGDTLGSGVRPASISVGFAELRPRDTLAQLTKRGDAALYESKRDR